MPISVECPDCGASRKVKDELEGKAIKCPDCGGRISVRRSSAKAAPAAKALPSKKSKSKKSKKKSSSNVGLLIGGSAVVVILLIGIGVFMAMRPAGDAPDVDQDLVENNTPAKNTSDEVATPANGTPATNPAPTPDPQMASNASPDKTSTPSPSGFKTPEAQAAEDLFFTVSADWALSPDSPTGETEYTQENPFRVKLAKEDLRTIGVVFPTGPSPFVAINVGTGNNHRYEVRDVRTGKVAGEANLSGFVPAVAVANDASYFAGAGSSDIEVIDMQAKKSLGKLSTAASGSFNVSHMAIWNNRIVAASFVHHGFKVWELPSGTLLHDVHSDDKFNPSYGIAFSPNGKYMAVIGHFLEKRIDIYDLDTGKVVGSITPGGAKSVNELEALGFSRDGANFAAIYGVNSSDRKYSRMLVWQLSTGKVGADFELERQLKGQLDPVYQSHELESLPGGNRWLAHSLGIIDVNEQSLIYGFPKQAGVDLVPSRKVMGENWVVAATTDQGDPRLEEISFTNETLLAGAKSAAAGGIASDANLPPLTASDMNTATDGLSSNNWNVKPDPLIAGAISDSIKIETSGTVRELAISRGPNPILAVRAGIKENVNDTLSAAYNRMANVLESKGVESTGYNAKQPLAMETELLAYDANGSATAKMTIPFSAKLHGTSPTGAFALVEEHRTNGRLDVYQLQDEGSHIVGWRPFGNASDKNHREIRKAEFVDDQHVAAVSKNYAFCTWSLPDAMPVWKLDEVLDFAMSPGGKTIVAVRGNILGSKSLDFYNAQDGEGQGKIELDGNVKSLAFHPNGTQLALSMEMGANTVMSVIDLNNGRPLEEIAVPVLATTLSWVGDDYILLNGQSLFSRPLQALVWSYEADDALLPRSQVTTDFTFLQLFTNRSLIRTVSLPSENAAAKFRPDKLKDLAILNPGDAVQLAVNVADGELPASLKDVATEALTTQLKAVESKVDANAPIILTVNVSLKNGESVPLTRIGQSSVSENVTRKTVTIDYVYSQEGKEIWTTSRRLGNLDRYLVRLKQGQSAQESIDEQMLENVTTSLKSMKLPRYIFKDGAGSGLGTSSFFE